MIYKDKLAERNNRRIVDIQIQIQIQVKVVCSYYGNPNQTYF